MQVTVENIAKETGRPARTVRWHCKKLGLRKVAGSYVLDARQARLVRASMEKGGKE